MSLFFIETFDEQSDKKMKAIMRNIMFLMTASEFLKEKKKIEEENNE